MSTPIELLKFNLQERTYPHFNDDELQILLDKNGENLNRASYEGCLMKAESEDQLEVSGIKLSSNRDYWITLANKFLADWKEEQKALKPNGYITSMQRSDGQ